MQLNNRVKIKVLNVRSVLVSPGLLPQVSPSCTLWPSFLAFFQGLEALHSLPLQNLCTGASPCHVPSTIHPTHRRPGHVTIRHESGLQWGPAVSKPREGKDHLCLCFLPYPQGLAQHPAHKDWWILGEWTDVKKINSKCQSCRGHQL